MQLRMWFRMHSSGPVSPRAGAARWRRSPSFVRRLLHSFYGFFDERSHRIWLRHVDRVTARYLDDCRTCALGHETLGRRWDHLVFAADPVPAPLGLPRRLASPAPSLPPSPPRLDIAPPPG